MIISMQNIYGINRFLSKKDIDDNITLQSDWLRGFWPTAMHYFGVKKDTSMD